MKKLMMMLSAALALFTTSCLEHHVTIELNKDGSGTITEETTLGQQAVQMMEQMAQMGGDQAGNGDPLADMADEDKAAERAEAMGEGVTVKSVEEMERGGRVVFAFEDINTVDYDFGNKVTEMQPAGPGGEQPEPEENTMDFEFADGVLTLRNKMVDDGSEPADVPDQPVNDQQLAQARQMMGDMKMSLRIKAPGGIEETNATHVEGDTVTLSEMHMGKVLENPEGFRKLQQSQAKTPADMQEALEGVDGVKVEAQEVVTIKLK